MNINKFIARRAERVEAADVTPIEDAPTHAAKAHKLANIQRDRARANAQSEISRITDLPICEPLDDIGLQVMNEECIKPEYLDKPIEEGGYRLFSEQANAVYSYVCCQGGFDPITVGGGKTLISLLIAQEAFKAGHSKIMLVIPPNLVDQLRDVDVPEYRTKCHINLPIHFIAGLTSRTRMSKAMSGCRGLYIFTFSLLSSPQGAEILEAIAPTTIIVDEAHNISGTRDSARAKRFNEYVDEAKPDLVALSGTMTRSTPMDYYSISRQALKNKNFLPNIKTMAQMWSDAIGSDASCGVENSDGLASAMSRPLLPIIQWARENFIDEQFDLTLSGFRKAFKMRLLTAPGVTSSGEDHLGITLKVINDLHKDPTKEKGWDQMQDLIEQVRDEYVTPCGDELECAMHLWKWLYEIEGAGFYNELYWPSIEWIEKYRKLDEKDAQDLLDKSKEYHQSRKDYLCELRKFLTNNSAKGLDTPMLVGHSMSVHAAEQVGTLLYDYWTTMKGKDFEGRLERLSRAIRICPFKINQAIKFCKTLPVGKGAILWFHSREVGRWLKERCEEEGIDHVYCPAGKQYNSIAIDKDHKDKVLIASISAHGTGKNLQHFEYEYYVQWPRDAKLAEQSIGRIHRNGQKADEVFIYTSFQSDFDRGVFSATLNDAAYIHQTLGNKQRLMYAEYDPIPEVVPYEVLKQWGAVGSGNHTDRDSQKLLKDKFSK